MSSAGNGISAEKDKHDLPDDEAFETPDEPVPELLHLRSEWFQEPIGIHNRKQEGEIRKRNRRRTKRLQVKARRRINELKPDANELIVDISGEYVFVLYNPTAGFGQCREFTTSGIQYVRFSEPSETEVFFYDIVQGKLIEDIPEGIVHLLRVVRSLGNVKKAAKVVVIGGTGTFMDVLEDCYIGNIELSKLVFSVIPCGLHNDVARSLGFRKRETHLLDSEMFTMKAIISEMSQFVQSSMDVWVVSVSLLPGGQFIHIDKYSGKKTSQATMEKEFIMASHFSIGLNSRIGLGVDKRRDIDKGAEKGSYFFETIKKSCRRSTDINTVIRKLEFFPPETRLLQIEEVDHGLTPNSGRRSVTPSGGEGRRFTIASETVEGTAVFCQNENDEQGTTQNIPRLKKCVSFAFVNTPYFFGNRAVWRNSKGKKGLSGGADRDILTTGMSLNDGKLEVMSFPSACPFSGLTGLRVGQGSGPWKLTFQELDESTRVYFQCDGECFYMTKPESLQIQHLQPIKVLCNPNSLPPSTKTCHQ
eukprot:GHVQ01000761.1.p1 GENE.GHVQ01000761.1~~GHVQ01000761.1.p1  ORF type:complete len:531 (+),score=66.99 GHVQ01000761.1:216-1808(+)